MLKLVKLLNEYHAIISIFLSFLTSYLTVHYAFKKELFLIHHKDENFFYSKISELISCLDILSTKTTDFNYTVASKKNIELITIAPGKYLKTLKELDSALKERNIAEIRTLRTHLIYLLSQR